MKFDVVQLESTGIDVIDGDRGKNYPHQNELLDTGFCLFLSAKNVTKSGFNFFETKFISQRKDALLKNGKLKRGDIVITTRGTVGNVALYSPQIFYDNVRINSGMLIIRCTNNISNQYLYQVLRSEWFQKQIMAVQSGSAQPQLPKSHFLKMYIPLPSLPIQEKIASILQLIDDKVMTNNAINNNLEQQISALFINMFGFNIDNLVENKFSLGDLVESVDNRGKTPPLSDKPTSYPIIDVKALSGDIRIVDYNNCTKYVDEETYNNWFRSGHPKQYDILISTVGSLAEMKIFLGDIGCIAQNVVGFRSKGVSPLYLYQYLNYIKSDLVAYNIGSVQPSIKVTHIIKHPIYVAPQDELDKFDSVARSITEKIFANCQENEDLKLLRDTLLPKLMSGELDVSDIDL